MKKEKKDFIEEITTNFAELFVETFLLRYLSNFDKNELLEAILITNNLLKEKINNKFCYSLEHMGYSKKDYRDYIK